MTVQELINKLQSYPQDLPVIYSKYSEFCLLEMDDVVVEDHCQPRPDGWVASRRPDKPTQKYLVIA